MSTNKKMKYHKYIVKPPSLKLKKNRNEATIINKINSLCIINV